MNETLQTIMRRRSVRAFKPDQLDPEELNAIIAAGLNAPSGHNDQSWFFSVIQNRALIDEMSAGSKQVMRDSGVEFLVNMAKNDNFNIYYHAPTVILAAARSAALTPEADISAGIQNMLIAAESLNIGSCWIGLAGYFFDTPEKLKRAGIPDGYKVHYAVALGHKPEGHRPANPPLRKYERYHTVIA
jgi:nitroreductase